MIAQILVRYGEIALKGKNRHRFEEALRCNIARALDGTGAQIFRRHGRFLVQTAGERQKEVLSRLSRVFGVVSASAVKSAALELEQLKATALELAKNRPAFHDTFKVETRRPNKKFPFTSPEISREIGSYLLEKLPQLKVDLHRPSFQISIEIGQQEAFLYHDSIRGPGGLPVGISGKAILMLSGGIDSPVAGWLAMKRGLALEALHFHSFPFTGERAQEKVIDLCRVLAGYAGGGITLHMINLAELQKELRRSCPEELGITLLRRVMVRAAEQIARGGGMKALVTGESLGQVASQTIENLAVISEATDMLILRPLLAMDKQEIIGRAREIETYDISIRPYEDCCTLFLPRHPAIRPSLEQVLKAESSSGSLTGNLLEESLFKKETISVGERS